MYRMKYINVVYGYNKVVQSAVSREHSSAPTKLPAPKPYKRVNSRHPTECVPTAQGKPNHPCAHRIVHPPTSHSQTQSYLTRDVDYSLDLPAEEIPCQMNQ